MKIRNLINLFALLFFIGFISCKQNTNNPNEDVVANDSVQDINHSSKVKTIFYNVPSPIEMASIMQRAGATYDHTLMNRIESSEKYSTNSKMAINLGVFGADLSYTRMFDQIQESVNYLSAIKKLADGLGIPQQPGTFAVSRIEQNIENKDSLLHIITDIYGSADIYLKESNRGSTASLIILGGWVEALYIATNIIDPAKPNNEVMERIAEQKYSLQNLIDLLKIYEKEEAIIPHIQFLEKVNDIYNKIEIVSTKAEVITDSVKKVTSISNNNKVQISLDNLLELRATVTDFRKELIK